MRKKYMLIGAVGIVVGVVLSSVVFVLAGALDSPGGPTDAASKSYSLEDIYERLNAGTAGSKSVFTEPAGGPGSTMHDLNAIMGQAPAVDDANGASMAEVANGKTFWGLTSGQWGLQTGTAAAGSDVSGAEGAKTFNIPDGLYAGSKTCTANDADLLAGNVKQGVNIFGVDGSLTAGSTYNAGVPKTGQTKCYDASGTEVSCTGTGQDGEYQKGVAWPSLRFTDNLDGTVTDNLTGLIWLKNGNCPNGGKNWSDALTFANSLYDGWTGDGSGGDCSLSDGSSAGDWRLPNLRELHSLIHFGLANSATWLNGQGFSGVQSDYYWSSTTGANFSSYAWSVGLGYGYVNCGYMTYTYYVWPVRGG